jgi:glycerate-2-kinase
VKTPLHYDETYQVVSDAEGDVVAIVAGSDFNAEKNHEHAREIVAAYNSHGPLVEACRAMESFFHRYKQFNEQTQDEMENEANAVLAQARIALEAIPK